MEEKNKNMDNKKQDASGIEKNETSPNTSNVKGSDNKKKKQIIILCVVLIIATLVLIVSFATMVAKTISNKNTTKYTPTSNTIVEEDSSIPNTAMASHPSATSNSNSIVNTTVTNIATSEIVTVKPTASPNVTKNEYVEQYEELSKNGENVLSDKPDNEFIKLVAEKYGVDKNLLVAIYSVPDTGTNFVLQFNGQKDANGKIIKSPDTLKKVYQIDKERNIKVATGEVTGNIGVSYGEGIFCFHMVKTLVMEQYPDYFTGLRK